MTTRITAIAFLVILSCLILLGFNQTTDKDISFTYLGQLSQKGIPYSGTADVSFTLWDAQEGGSAISATQRKNNITITDGMFKLPLSFNDSAFSNNATRWLEVSVRAPAGKGSFTTLSPRREVAHSGTFNGGINNDRLNNGNENIQLMAPDWFINAPNSIYLNIDADNNQTDSVLEIAKDRTGDTGGTSLLKVQEDGKVGIGTTTPGEMLTVAGVIESLSGGIKFPDLTVQVTAFDGTIDWSNIYNIPAGFADGIDDGSFIWQDTWDNSTNYSIDDVVYYGGSSYIAITANLNEPPDVNPQSWSMMAQQGAEGPMGPEGPQGPPGDDALWAVNETSMYYNDGWVGIGDATPDYPLDVETTNGTSAVFGANAALSGHTYGGYFRSDSSNLGTGVYGLASASFGFTYGGYCQSDSTDGIGVLGYATATTGFAIGAQGTSDSNGGTGVFGYATASSGINHGVQGRSNSASGFDFFALGVGTDYGSASSRRWKKNIKNISWPLDKLAQLRGVYYDWNQEHGGKHDVGMIAEEVGAVLPEIVQYEENGIDAIGMDYSKLTPLLVEAVNALRAEKDTEIDKLREQNALLESRLSQLEAIVAQLSAQ